MGIEARGDDAAVVDMWAFPSPDGPPTLNADWLRHLLTKNASYRFGACNLQPNGQLLVEQVVLGEDLTKDGLQILVVAVSTVADEIAFELGGAPSS